MPTRCWLVKQEPEAYPWSQLVADKQTAWTGVRNFQARNHLRAMKAGASDYLKKPVDLDEMMVTVGKAMRAGKLQSRLSYSQTRETHAGETAGLLGDSAKLSGFKASGAATASAAGQTVSGTFGTIPKVTILPASAAGTAVATLLRKPCTSPTI